MHGLRAQSPRTWEAHLDGSNPKSGTVNWLKDSHMLPATLPESRILTYDWNANIVGDASQDRFLGHAETLLERLDIDRHKTKRLERPIIFIASCFSGLLLAKALVRAADAYHARRKAKSYSQILHATVGILFLGTPFRGSWEAGTQNAKICIDLARAQRDEFSQELPQYLRPHGREDAGGGPSPLDEVVQRFAEMLHHEAFEVPIVCFYETRATKKISLFKGVPPESRPENVDDFEVVRLRSHLTLAQSWKVLWPG